MKNKTESEVLFADATVESLETEKTLPAKFGRLLKRLRLSDRVKGKTVAIKMHLGGYIGFTTIHPVFVRILVKALQEAGAKTVKIMDGGNPQEGIARGYVREVLGCEVVSCFGASGKYLYPEKIGFKSLDEVLFGGEACDCDFFLDLSHIKGHGDCGFGGALKNISMGIVPPPSRAKIHSLEGGLTIDREKCTYCQKCFKACPNKAIETVPDQKRVQFFFHNCTYCQHCVMICPEKAIQMENRRFEDFCHGMALVSAKFLSRFQPENLLFINFLTQITIYCDCWGMSTPALVPDLGILASEDIVAVETASLDMIKTENFIPNGLPKGRKLLPEGKHLFEKIHAKDPYAMLRDLEECYGGSSQYRLEEIK